MAFDQATRNRLQKFVSDARGLLVEEFSRQMQHDYGMDPDTGTVSAVDSLLHLTDSQHQTAKLLRETMAHYQASSPGSDLKEILGRIVREQAFTVLNRLCALRMAEARGILIESIAKGYNSKGFQLYARLAGTALGETGDTYRNYLFSIFDEFSIDLAVLFDRYSPMGRLFPKETALLALLSKINDFELESLWAEDETIGWIYQYFNSAEERRQMRAEAQAPRNSRELAVRNQFFTPRYVVEFLTDNTLGRIWYEMTQGQTILKDQCRYLVRRPDEVFLWIDNGPVLDWLQGKELESEPQIAEIAHAVNGYLRAGGLHDGAEDWFNRYVERIRNQEAETFTTQEVLDFLFVFHRADRFCEGLLNKHNNEVQAVFQILKTRIEKSRQESLTQEELLNLPVFIPLRAKKDPRDIKILDPACGSGHFLLYAFILLLTIYREAWDQENDLKEIPTVRSKGLRPLREIYDSKESFMADVPRLIMEYNLHGIDIDPRAVQIAGLSLWLCAQRTWKEQDIKPADRPQIKKSNIVCAEPMPGEKEFLKSFSETLKPRVLGQLVEIIFEKMELAGEAGSLLKIEEEIEEAVEKAREEFNKELLRRKEEAGYLPGFAPKIKQRSLFDFADLPDKTQFWQTAEEKILEALRNYAERAEAEDGSRLRLFAEDAAKGFAFIDLCKNRYDVVLMNPPFGESSIHVNIYLKSHYGFGRPDFYMCFMFRTERFIEPLGRCGAITSRTFLTLQFFDSMRELFLTGDLRLDSLLDLGNGVLDGATVETCCHVSQKINSSAPIIFINLSNHIYVDKVAERLSIMSKGQLPMDFYVRQPGAIKAVPGSVFAYRMVDSALRAFTLHPPIDPKYSMNVPYSMESQKSNFSVRQGLIPGNQFRFSRLWHEVPSKGKDWSWASKGGDFSRYLSIEDVLLAWGESGSEMKAFAEQNYGGASRTIKNEQLFFRRGVTFPRVNRGLNARVLPSNFIFTDTGMAVIPKVPRNSWAILGFLNSRFADYLCNSLHPGRKYEIAHISSLPLHSDILTNTRVKNYATESTHLMETLLSGEESQPWFLMPFLIRNRILNKNQTQNPVNADAITSRLSEIQQNLNSLIYDTYGIPINEREVIEDDLREGIPADEFAAKLTILSKAFLLPEQYPRDKKKLPFNTDGEVKKLISYFVGAIFGRWDIRIAINPSLAPKLPYPFDSLSLCPPGMLFGPGSLPAKPNNIVSEEWLRVRSDPNTYLLKGFVSKETIHDSGYPLRIDWNGILVDDPGFHAQPYQKDIIRRLREVQDVLWKDKAQEFEQEACAILNVTDLRDYFRKPAKFFQDHLKRYSKSRRQAPIYWPLSTPSGSYTLWLYYHRLTDQILYTCVNNFLEPKLKQVSDDVEHLRKKTKRTSQEEKDLEKLSDFALELKDFRDELLHIARFWKPNLNDGVQIIAAPLWKLFQYKPWQKKLKQTWKDLEKGKYDWAHLAYSIWPERVIRASHKDRSYAIAHDLENDLWEEIEVGTDRQGNPKTKWVPKKLSKKELEKIIQKK